MRADNHNKKKKIKASDNAKKERAEKGDGMRMGYHSEKANPGKHSKRLHKKHE